VSNDCDVLIVGAGPTGVSAAIECARANLSYRIVDQRTETTQWSQALVVQARTLEQLDRYGLADAFVKKGHKVQSMRAHAPGRPLSPITLDSIPGKFPYALFLPQVETEALLRSGLERLDGHIEYGVRLTAFRDEGNGVSATLTHNNQQTESVHARRIIACDGAHSTVRQLLGISFAGSAVDMHFYLSDSCVEGSDRPIDSLSLYFGEGEFLFVAPVTPTETRIMFATHDTTGPTRALTDAEMQAAITRISQGQSDMTIMDSSWRSPFHVNERCVPSFKVENVFFAGDAAHIPSPAFGQGMNTGIQDVANLVWKIAAVHNGAPEVLLESYHHERSTVAKNVISASSYALAMATTDNPVLAFLRNTAEEAAAHSVFLREKLSGFLSETAVSYRGSAIVTDRGGHGHLHAGDRAPDMWNDSDQTGLLSELRTSRHVVLVNPAMRQRLNDLHSEKLSIRTIDAAIHYGEGASAYDFIDTCYVLRPDGYIGYRGPAEDTHSLSTYLAHLGA
jgi:2-polyprenyl-6-methoxyphenol hydroxylase-like FAD-dependent oxidoreductase